MHHAKLSSDALCGSVKWARSIHFYANQIIYVVKWMMFSRRSFAWFPFYSTNHRASSLVHLKWIWIKIKIFSIAWQSTDSFASSHFIWLMDGWMDMHPTVCHCLFSIWMKWTLWILDCHKSGFIRKRNICSNHRLALI